MAELVGNGKRVLDIGCGEGALTQLLVSNGNDVVAVERDDRLAQKARARGLTVFARDIHREAIVDLGTFDVVVCADILEHLVDPLAALAKVKVALRKGGILVTSIPNIAYYPVRLRLLRGRFNYTDGGTLDRTHLRFYTHRTVHDLLRDGGFQPAKEEISVFLPLGFSPLTRAFNNLLERRRAGPALYKILRSFPGFFAYQFITASTAVWGAGAGASAAKPI